MFKIRLLEIHQTGIIDYWDLWSAQCLPSVTENPKAETGRKGIL